MSKTLSPSASTLFDADDHRHMARALQLAERGLWTTSPNPRVGCVLVRNGNVIGEGWHVRAGGPHAEVAALEDARRRGNDPLGCTAYVTLEPCSHHGRTPPCADALIAARLGRVVAAMRDPNPLVAGKGLDRLSAAGIQTACGLNEVGAQDLNPGFISRMTRGRPWVRVKLAASLDGRTALAGGESQWITGVDARRDVQRWRARASAILTGSGTVLADDPRLTIREPEIEVAQQPLRVVVDSSARVSPRSAVFRGGALWVTAGHRPADIPEGVECIDLADGDHVSLAALLMELGRRGVNELHVEAGPKLSGALLRAGLVDEFLLYLAPCLIGDTGRGLFSLPGLDSLADRPQLRIVDLRQVGADLRLLARFN